MSPRTGPSSMPLAELHCHLEGTVSPPLALKLAARHAIDLAPLIGPDGNWQWASFLDFLRVYDAMSEVIRTAEDHYDVTRAYFEECAALGMRYGEIFVSPAHAGRHGLPYPDLIDAIAAALRDAESAHDVHGRIIITCVRHFGVAHAESIARLAERHPHGHVTGFGIAGDETHGHGRDYARAFAIARGAGLRTTAHAGEVMGPESVRDTLDHLRVDRIGHGVRAIESPALVAELAARGVPLEICPGSNIAMKLFDSIAAHPVRRLYDAGVMVTLSTDDPAFFHTTIRREYDLIADAHGFTMTELLALTRNSIRAAFCEDPLKERLLREVTEWEHAALARP